MGRGSWDIVSNPNMVALTIRNRKDQFKLQIPPINLVAITETAHSYRRAKNILFALSPRPVVGYLSSSRSFKTKPKDIPLSTDSE